MMRQKRTIQSSLFDIFSGYQIGVELKVMSALLDGAGSAVLDLVAADLGSTGVKQTDRQCLPAEWAFRCALLKQQRQLSYEELAFHLEDSSSFGAFARLPQSLCPKKSVLQKTISRIRPETSEQINWMLLTNASQEKIERGTVVRIDSPVCEALMHGPTDSSLLWDAVRVLTRLLKVSADLPGSATISWRNHKLLAKKRAMAIRYSRGKDKKAKLYKDLIEATHATIASVRRVKEQFTSSIEGEV
jgi:IS5 family transposase